MYTAPPNKKRQPRYKGCIVCERCDAEFKPADENFKWYRASHGGKNDTTGNVDLRGQLPDNECPVCGTTFKVEEND